MVYLLVTIAIVAVVGGLVFFTSIIIPVFIFLIKLVILTIACALGLAALGCSNH